MSRLRTTICCSGRATRLFFTILLLAPFACAGVAAPPTPTPSLFPLGVVWTVELGGATATRPAYDEEHAYLPLRSGQLIAVSLVDGRRRWARDLSTGFPPAAGGRIVFVASGDTIHAISAADGTPRWQLPLGAECSAPLLWDTGWLIAGLDGGEVLALRADDGTEIWRRKLKSTMRVIASIGGDAVYLALENGLVVSLDLKTGDQRWEHKLGGQASEILALDDRLFVGAADNFFYCLSLKDGRTKWNWRTAADVIGAPIVDESRVYFVSLDNVLRALDRDSGVQQWHKVLPSRPSAGPVRAGEVLFVSGLTPELRGYSRRDGSVVGVFSAPADLVAPPHFREEPRPDGGTLIVLIGLIGGARLQALRRAAELPLTPLDSIPGTALPPEAPPRS